jgi:solute carrier family 25 carnitine/acylcarnitine transporter 20/29
VKVEEEKKDTD